jgi:hypothetical protein
MAQQLNSDSNASALDLYYPQYKAVVYAAIASLPADFPLLVQVVGHGSEMEWCRPLAELSMRRTTSLH